MMRKFLRSSYQFLNKPIRWHFSRWLPSFRHCALVISLVALVSLAYVAGAATMFFGLPSSGYLTKSFLGLQDTLPTQTPSRTTTPELPPQIAVNSKDAFDGYTLVTMSDALEAKLLNMQGEAVHQWRMRERRPWPRTMPVREPLPDEPLHWERVYLYPNGDLLALCAAGIGSPYGYGLAKFDKDSHLLWGYSANAHHDFDVGDDGRIYLLTQSPAAKTTPPEPGLRTIPDPPEELVVLSPDGQELDKFPLYEAFHDSPYFLLYLASLESRTNAPPMLGNPSPPRHVPPSADHPRPPRPPALMAGNGVPMPPDQLGSGDTLHSNSVKVLPQALADQFPQFQPGMVLISFRSPSLVAMVDPQRHVVTWASRGVWQLQHDARFLDNGHLLLFDNAGSSRGARVLEIDPATQAIAWSYTGDESNHLFVPFRGGAQRLPNGNTLIVDPSKRLWEIAPSKKTVWEFILPQAEGVENSQEAHCFTGARRYAPDALNFLTEKGSNQPK